MNVMEIKNIFAGYSPSEPVLRNINCVIKKGLFYGIIGKNGAGKSSLLKIICALLKPFCGEIYFENRQLYKIPKKELSKKISFLPQNMETDIPFTVEDFVMLGRYPKMNMFKIPSETDKVYVKEALRFTGIESFSKRYINELSGGEKQAVLIAQTLAQGSDFMVFDEPTAHLDIGTRVKILSLLKSLNKKFGKTIIVTSHDLNAASEFCDELILIDKGQIKNSGSPERVLNSKDIEDVYEIPVTVEINPVSKKPYVLPVSEDFL